jgi:hypothetical protein
MHALLINATPLHVIKDHRLEDLSLLCPEMNQVFVSGFEWMLFKSPTKMPNSRQHFAGMPGWNPQFGMAQPSPMGGPMGGPMMGGMGGPMGFAPVS